MYGQFTIHYIIQSVQLQHAELKVKLNDLTKEKHQLQKSFDKQMTDMICLMDKYKNENNLAITEKEKVIENLSKAMKTTNVCTL